MAGIIIPAAVGIFISALGVLNMKGNIASIHWYHRQRVMEADKKPFGRLVGFGTLLIGFGCILFGGFSALTEITKCGGFTVAGSVVLVLTLVVGFVLSIYAMVKYNRGIF